MQLLKKKAAPADEGNISKPPRRPLKKGPIAIGAGVLILLAVTLLGGGKSGKTATWLLYTSDAADDLLTG